MASTRDFMDALFRTAPPDTYYELRLIAPRLVDRYFGPLPLQDEDLDQALTLAVGANITGSHVYLVIQPRLRRGGKGTDVAGYGTFVLDLDAKPEGNAAIKQLTDAGLRPSAIVRSGRGGHLYLFLDQLAEVAVAQPVAERLVRWIGGDSVFDAPRVMRLPGTTNIKPHVMLPCELIDLDADRRYSVDNIIAVMDAAGAPMPPAVPEPKPPRERQPRDPGVTPITIEDLDNLDPAERERLRAIRGRLSPRIQGLLDHGLRPSDKYPSRSEAEMAVVRALVSAGATDDDVVFLFRARPSGIGQRLFEHGPSVLHHTIEKVRTRDATNTSRVRVLEAGYDTRRSRLMLRLEVIDGEHVGVVFDQGFRPGGGKREVVRRYMLASLELPDPPPSLEAYVAREATVELDACDVLLEVHRWLPRGAAGR